ncbi:MAG: GDP-4-keto-6-deoxy-D-mannose 3-dehydratase [Verrucomicrobiae bacterium]|nr:GDP-4-keto-6-deoxy-D-mannose 3-dehydratase [Verrucomicrobiae bacterium]
MTTLEQLLEQFRQQTRAFLSQKPVEGKIRIPLNAPTFNEDEIVEALHCLLTQNVTMGDKVRLFERQFAEYLGLRHAIMVNSGSSANLLAMAALINPLCPAQYRLQPGAEVIVPAVTWPTTLWPVINMGLVPVLVDADPRTLNLDPAAVRAAVSPKTKAIFVAHILGNAADMDALQMIAREHKLVLLEDSCESLGTTYRGKFTGHFSLAATYSFFFSHHITTMEGGMVVTNDDALADLFRCLRSHGWSRHMQAHKGIEQAYPDIDPRFLFINIGYNLRATDVQAAFGLHQLKKLTSFNTQRRQLAAAMLDGLRPLADDLAVIEPTDGVMHTWFGFPVVLRERHRGRRKEFVQHLESCGIETRPIIAGNLARQPALAHYAHRIAGNLKNAQAIMDGGVYWGIHPFMTLREVDYVLSVVREFFRRTS